MTDLDILASLLQDGRKSLRMVSRELGISLRKVQNRLKKLMEDEKVLIGFITQVGFGQFGFVTIFATIRLRTGVSKEDALQHLLKSLSYPFYLASCIGDFHLLVAFYAKNISDVWNEVRKARLPEVADLEVTMQLPGSEAKFLPKSLKKVDWRIIQSLRYQGRRDFAQVAKEVQRSTKTVRRKCRHLQREGLISVKPLTDANVTSKKYHFCFLFVRLRGNVDVEKFITQVRHELMEKDLIIYSKVTNTLFPRPLGTKTLGDFHVRLSFHAWNLGAVDKVIEAVRVKPEVKDLQFAITTRSYKYFPWIDQFIEGQVKGD